VSAPAFPATLGPVARELLEPGLLYRVGCLGYLWRVKIAGIEGLYRSYGPSVLRRARSILKDEQRAQDVMQEVFIRALQSADALEAADSTMAWLYRVTRNLCLNRIRDDNRRRDLLNEHGESLRPSEHTNTHARVVLNELLQRIAPELRDVAVCFYLDQMTQTEIAEHLGVSRRTVGYRLQSLRTVAHEMSDEGD
jgi:RNA polymerase sigma-70 factor (ECF subfamily)